jgi:hypothetical protein
VNPNAVLWVIFLAEQTCRAATNFATVAGLPPGFRRGIAALLTVLYNSQKIKYIA